MQYTVHVHVIVFSGVIHWGQGQGILFPSMFSSHQQNLPRHNFGLIRAKVQSYTNSTLNLTLICTHLLRICCADHQGLEAQFVLPAMSTTNNVKNFLTARSYIPPLGLLYTKSLQITEHGKSWHVFYFKQFLC